MNEKTVFILVFVLMLIMALTGCNSNTTISSKAVSNNEINEIKIGAILPLTGELAFIGEEIQKGMMLAVEEINQNNLIKNKKLIKLKIIFEDDQLVNPRIATTAAHKLINVDKVSATVVTAVNDAKSIAPIFESAKIPLIVLWDSNKDIESWQYIFSTGFSTEKAGKSMADFAYNNLKLKNVVIVSHIDEWADIISNSFIKEFKSLGGNIIFQEKVPVEESDFRTILTKIKSSADIDGIYLPFAPMNTDLFLKQAKELGINIPIMTGDAFTDEVIGNAGFAAEGVYYTNIFVEDNENTKHLIDLYLKKYNKEPSALVFVTFGYDSVMLLKEAMLKSNEITTITPKEIQKNLYGLSMEGSGGYIEIKESGMADRIEKIFKIVDGKPIFVES